MLNSGCQVGIYGYSSINELNINLKLGTNDP